MPIFSAIQYLTRLVESKYYQEFVIGQESIELPYRLWKMTPSHMASNYTWWMVLNRIQKAHTDLSISCSFDHMVVVWLESGEVWRFFIYLWWPKEMADCKATGFEEKKDIIRCSVKQWQHLVGKHTRWENVLENRLSSIVERMKKATKWKTEQ